MIDIILGTLGITILFVSIIKAIRNFKGPKVDTETISFGAPAYGRRKVNIEEFPVGDEFVASEKSKSRESQRLKDTYEQFEVGGVYDVKVMAIINEFAAIVELIPFGPMALLPLSEIVHRRINRVEDILHLGQIIQVKVVGLDEGGKPMVSRRILLPIFEESCRVENIFRFLDDVYNDPDILPDGYSIEKFEERLTKFLTFKKQEISKYKEYIQKGERETKEKSNKDAKSESKD